MTEETISALLSMQNALNARRQQLNELKGSLTMRSTSYGLNNEKIVAEPTYDIKKVDKKLAAINKALFRIDQKIKEANAMTKISVDIDFDALMAEID